MAVLDPRISRSIRRSKIRRKILQYLLEIYPGSSYPAEIAEKIRTTPSNVIGALRGNGGRYHSLLSLTFLSLVRETEAEGKKYYRLSKKGRGIAQALNGSLF